MPKQNFGAGTGVPDPPRQGEKGGQGGDTVKEGRSTGPGESGSNKSGKGAGSAAGGKSGKTTGSSKMAKKGNNVSDKGSGNR